jgi:hypothetical protein
MCNVFWSPLESLPSHRGGPGLRSGICGGQSGTGAGFLRALWFSLPIFTPPNSPSSQLPRAGTIGHSVADVLSGSSFTPHYAKKKALLICSIFWPKRMAILNQFIICFPHIIQADARNIPQIRSCALRSIVHVCIILLLKVLLNKPYRNKYRRYVEGWMYLRRSMA